nr:methionyl-tRNA formyltransferase [Mycoplasma simbae]
MKLLLAGTPEFSVPIFEELINNFEVVGIVSQPDRPSQRGRVSVATPTKQLAQKYNIVCFQPEKIGDIYDELSKLEFDYLVTAAFGQFIPTKILGLAKKLNINVHGSLLPLYRGAAPIQYSVWKGNKTTGVSLMEMVKEMDAGDVFAQASVEIDEDDTSANVFEKIQQLSSKNIVSWINQLDKDELKRVSQDPDKITYSPKLNKEDGFINSEMSIDLALRTIKAFYPNPCAYTFIDNKRVKINFATKTMVKNAPVIELADGKIYLTDYHFEGKKRVILK